MLVGLCVQFVEILPFSSDIANELNEMVLSQGMLDLRSFGYGHRYIAGVKKIHLNFVSKVLAWSPTTTGARLVLN